MPEQRKTGRRKQGTRRKIDDRRPVRCTTSVIDLFHRLWGEAKDGVYVKENWQEFQRRLERL